MQIPSLQKLPQIPDLPRRAAALLVGLMGLLVVYFNQQFNYLAIIDYRFHPYTVFIVNRTVRYLLNDSFSILIIYAIFYKRSYVIAGFLVELIGLVILLPLYFILKLYFEGDTEISSPLFSFFHRLIINPTLMILLIMGMFYQQKTQNR